LLDVHREAARTAALLPRSLRFGTSSWSFPGWQGLVYAGARSQAALARDGLREYARHPLLRTVGVDRSYYAPVPREDLLRYADQLPDGFPCCFKAPASVTSAVVPFTRSGPPVRNPDFLSAERLSAELLEPLAEVFRSRTGPIVIECAPLPRGVSMAPGEFAERLDEMLGVLPAEFKYAVEIRTAPWLNPEYVRVLARHGAGHVYNYWSAMPSLARQAEVAAPEVLDLAVVRLLLRPGTWYEDQRERFKPFDRLVEPDEAMREEVCDLVGRAMRRALPVYVLVNNKAEGSAPLTVAALASRVASRQAVDASAIPHPGARART
jgi:uncharacterized protein YecE (DUF72 family)